MKVSRKVFYEGKVQGVGFRWTLRDLASGFDVAGTVANLPDGRVELCVKGDASEVNSFLLAINESSLASHITSSTSEEWTQAPASVRGFQIIR